MLKLAEEEAAACRAAAVEEMATVRRTCAQEAEQLGELARQRVEQTPLL